MKVTRFLPAFITGATAVAVGLFSAEAGPRDGGDGGVAGVPVACQASIGPDVIVGDLPDLMKYGTVGDISAYAIGTTSCNMGSAPVLWQSSNPNHPVIGQHIFRLKDGRFEQIGLSWLKHGFTALSGSLCCPCQGGGGSILGVGCSDPYGASLNGSQGNLGPRNPVNATTGVFPYPWSSSVPAAAATIGRRIQVHIGDLDPALNPGALYFGEGHYVTADDATAGNAWNNASFRRITVGTLTSGSWTLSFSGSTQRQRPAIEAWKDNDAAVTLVDINVPGDGRMTLGYKVTDLGGGMFHYEYALHNLNSHRSGGSFSIPVPPGVQVSNIGFHDVDYHSGDGFGTSPTTPVTYDGTDWNASVSGGAITWTTTDFATSQNANALRWGTLYNFRFDANTAPQSGNASVGLWRPGTPSSVNVPSAGPGPAPVLALADLNHDGTVDGLDLGMLLAAWGPCVSQICVGNLNGDMVVDGLDLAELLADWKP